MWDTTTNIYVNDVDTWHGIDKASWRSVLMSRDDVKIAIKSFDTFSHWTSPWKLHTARHMQLHDSSQLFSDCATFTMCKSCLLCNVCCPNSCTDWIRVSCGWKKKSPSTAISRSFDHQAIKPHERTIAVSVALKANSGQGRWDSLRLLIVAAISKGKKRGETADDDNFVARSEIAYH